MKDGPIFDKGQIEAIKEARRSFEGLCDVMDSTRMCLSCPMRFDEDEVKSGCIKDAFMSRTFTILKNVGEYSNGKNS